MPLRLLLGRGYHAINTGRSLGTEACIIGIRVGLGFAPQSIKIILAKATSLLDALNRIAELAGLVAIKPKIAFCCGNTGLVGGNQISRS